MAWGLPSTRAQTEGLKVHPGPGFPPRLERRGFVWKKVLSKILETIKKRGELKA